MLERAFFDIVQSLKGEKLILFHAGVVVTQNGFKIVVAASFYNQLVKLPVQLREAPGVREPVMKLSKQMRKRASKLSISPLEMLNTEVLMASVSKRQRTSYRSSMSLDEGDFT